MPATNFDAAIWLRCDRDVGELGAASAAASLAKAVCRPVQEVLAGPSAALLAPRPRRMARAARRSRASGADGSHFAFLLEEHAKKTAI